MRRGPQSLQARLTLLVLALVAAAWLLVAALIAVDVRHELDELLDSHLAQAAAILVVQQAAELDDLAEGHDRPERPGLDAPVLHRYASKVAFQVFHEGRPVLRSANAPAAPMVDPGEHFQTGLRTLTIAGTAWRVFAAHGAERDVQVFVGEQMPSRAAILSAVLRGLLLPMVLALPLLALAAWWAVRLGMAPLRRLGRLLATRQPQALQAVALDDAPTEMRPLLDALNGLFGRISALMASERRFTADAAHELRTPIAAIRAQAQVALAEPDAEARRHALQATLAGCDRAGRLMTQLLTLSRLDTGDALPQLPVDLAALARRVVGELAPQALARGQSIALDAPPSAAVTGDETLLAVLLRNLVDNAIRYAPDGARIAVQVQLDGGQVTLCVDDSGPGLAEADLARLGERFFRVLGSAQGGSGLGWSIVRRIAQVHGATLQVERSATLGGLGVRVRWPALR